MEFITVYFITKILLTIFVIVLVPIYWKNYGPQNFLWLSDVGLFLTLLALWFDSPLLMSMGAVGIFPLELVWIIDFFFELLTGKKGIGLAGYMFDPRYTRLLRCLSLFHIFVPVIWMVFLYKWGYDRHAFVYQAVLIWIILVLTYLLTNPEKNINWVYAPKAYHWERMPLPAWLLLMAVSFPLVALPFHVLFSLIF